ncbi:MAG: HAMP domain-containing sensor histidine kinase [Pseudomonadota bacterium]
MAELGLPFPSEELEHQFRCDWYRSALPQIRIALALALVFLVGFAQLDRYYFSEPLQEQIFYFRWLVIAPANVVILAATFSAIPGRQVYWMMTVTLCVMTGYFAWLTPSLDLAALTYVLPLLVQLALFQLVLLRVPIRIAAVGAAVSFAAILAAFLTVPLPVYQKFSIIGGFSAIYTILLFSGYQRERQQRWLFMSEAQLRQSLRDRDEIQDERASWYENLARFLRHELSNQLVGARTSLQLIERFGDRRLEYIGRARRSLDRMQLMLNETSDASSIEQALKTEEQERFSLSLLVIESVEEYRDQYPQHRIALDVAEQVELIGQPFRIAQLLDKLVSNAVRYTHEDVPIEVSLSAPHADGQVALSVANRGAPLPLQTERLFDLWSTSASYGDDKQMGLGLYVAARVAEAHGGAIHAERLEAPTGARFVVTLPALHASAPRSEARP